MNDRKWMLGLAAIGLVFLFLLGEFGYSYFKIAGIVSELADTGRSKVYRHHVVLISQELDNPYWRTVGSAAAEEAKQYNMDLEYIGPFRLNPAEQTKLLDKMIASKVDGILVQGFKSDEYTALINKAIDRRIPVITVDTDSADSKRLTYVGTDNVSSGAKLGEVVLQSLGVKAGDSGGSVGKAEGEGGAAAGGGGMADGASGAGAAVSKGLSRGMAGAAAGTALSVQSGSVAAAGTQSGSGTAGGGGTAGAGRSGGGAAPVTPGASIAAPGGTALSAKGANDMNGVVAAPSSSAPIHIGVIIGSYEAENQQQRLQGFLGVVKPAPGVVVDGVAVSNISRIQAAQAAEQLLRQHPGINVMVGTSALDAVGILQAVKTLGVQERVRIFGFDDLDETKQAIARGEIVATVIQKPDEMGREAVRQLHAYFEGVPLETNHFTPYEVLDRSNVGEGAAP